MTGSEEAERRLILLSAGIGTRREAARGEARRAVARVDWPRLAETLRQRKLLTLLGPRILRLTEGSASSGFAAAVEQALAEGRRQNMLLELFTRRVMAMLADAGIRCAPLKGPLLGQAIYGDGGQRLSADIDLLIAAEQLSAAVEVVRELGYAPPGDHLQAGELPLLHFTLVHERGQLPPVELHWRVHWYEQSFARERLLPPGVDRSGDWRPAPADELVALLLFYARDGFIDLRLATDLSAWWDTYGADLPSHALGCLPSAYPALTRAVLASLAAAEKVVGLPAAGLLASLPALRARERVAARLANPNPDHASHSQLYADMGLIDGLLAPPEGFRSFIKRQLLPPSEVREKQALHGAKRRARSPLGRLTGVLGRYGLAIPRLLRSPKALP